MDGVGGDGHPQEAVATHHPVASAAPSAGHRDNSLRRAPSSCSPVSALADATPRMVWWEWVLQAEPGFILLPNEPF